MALRGGLALPWAPKTGLMAIRASVSKNCRRPNSKGTELERLREAFEFTHQITEDGWHHVGVGPLREYFQDGPLANQARIASGRGS